MRLSLTLAVALALAACAPEEADLKAELARYAKDFRGDVPPLPTMRPPPDARYRAGSLPDPFYPK